MGAANPCHSATGPSFCPLSCESSQGRELPCRGCKVVWSIPAVTAWIHAFTTSFLDAFIHFEVSQGWLPSPAQLGDHVEGVPVIQALQALYRIGAELEAQEVPAPLEHLPCREHQS